MQRKTLGGGREIKITQVLARAGLPALFAWALLLLTYFHPILDATRAPYFDLTSTFAVIAYWISESGGKIGAPTVVVLMLLALITRPESSSRQRRKEVMLLSLLVVICAGGGAALTEHGVKAALKVPRPNILWLAGADGSGPLGMRSDTFYELGDKNVRREALRKVLEGSPSPVALTPEIQEHWIKETGYSFPSGHSYAAMFVATFFLAMGVSYLTGRRLWLFYLLLPWAIAVCYSRSILRVHTPTDVTIGGLEGMVIGLIACFVARSLLRQ